MHFAPTLSRGHRASARVSEDDPIKRLNVLMLSGMLRPESAAAALGMSMEEFVGFTLRTIDDPNTVELLREVLADYAKALEQTSTLWHDLKRSPYIRDDKGRASGREIPIKMPVNGKGGERRSREWEYVVKCLNCHDVQTVAAELDSAGELLPATENLICRVCHNSNPILDETLRRKAS